MDICFLFWEYPPNLIGGLGTYATYISNKMKENHYLYVLTPQIPNTLEYERHKNIEIYRIPLLKGEVPLKIISEEVSRWGSEAKLFNDVFMYNILSAHKIINELIIHENIDIISAHDWLSAFAVPILKKHTNLPVVFHLHSTEELRSNLSNALKSIEHESGRIADKIITVSYAMKEHLINIGYEESKIEVVHNGIDEKIFNVNNIDRVLVNKLLSNYGIENQKVLLYVGRLTYIKGVRELIEIFNILSKRVEDIKLIIVGIGEEKEYIDQKVKEYKLENKVVLINRYLTLEELIAHYAIADISIFPSLQEPFGIVSLESMALETPVVVGAKGVSGFKEQVITEGEDRCGRYIDPLNHEESAKIIEDMLINEDLNLLGKNARKRVEKEFTLEKTVNKTLEIYSNLIP